MTHTNTTPTIDAEQQDDAIQKPEKDHAAALELETPLATTFDELLGDDDSPDETADDIIRAVREWRETKSNRSLD